MIVIFRKSSKLEVMEKGDEVEGTKERELSFPLIRLVFPALGLILAAKYARVELDRRFRKQQTGMTYHPILCHRQSIFDFAVKGSRLEFRKE